MQNENPLKSVALSFICNEDWDKMHPNSQGRHCSVCNKTVVDFTDKTQTDFEKAMKEANGKLCGRFKTKQTIHLPEFRFDRAAAVLMATAALSLTSQQTLAQQKTVGKIAMPAIEQPSVKGNIKRPDTQTLRREVAIPAPKDTIIKQPVNWVKPPKKDWRERVMLGDTIGPMPPEPIDTNTIDTTRQLIPHSIPPNNFHPNYEPVFPGGDEAMQKAIAYNLRWPVKLEEDTVVYVQMIVDKEGLVKDAYIIQGYRVDVNAEAIRVASLLVFTPAKNEFGNTIESVKTIPINFIRK